MTAVKNAGPAFRTEMRRAPGRAARIPASRTRRASYDGERASIASDPRLSHSAGLVAAAREVDSLPSYTAQDAQTRDAVDCERGQSALLPSRRDYQLCGAVGGRRACSSVLLPGVP